MEMMPTLYQCFLTLPSVLFGKDYQIISFSSQLCTTTMPTFAIVAQLSPLSRMTFSRCSSAGVQGVLTLLFFTIG